MFMYEIRSDRVSTLQRFFPLHRLGELGEFEIYFYLDLDLYLYLYLYHLCFECFDSSGFRCLGTVRYVRKDGDDDGNGDVSVFLSYMS